MKSFSPDLVLISAGFDAHEADPLGQLLLDDASYERITKRLKEAALTTGGDESFLCLEGGYNLRALSDAAHAHVRAILIFCLFASRGLEFRRPL